MSSRLLLSSATRQTARFVPLRTCTISQRSFSQTPEVGSGSQNDSPGWGGRKGDDHVLHRDGKDAQSKPSVQARQDKEAGKEGSSAITQKDEKKDNQKAKDDFPEAPKGPVIGMNDERGGKGQT